MCWVIHVKDGAVGSNPIRSPTVGAVAQLVEHVKPQRDICSLYCFWASRSVRVIFGDATLSNHLFAHFEKRCEPNGVGYLP